MVKPVDDHERRTATEACDGDRMMLGKRTHREEGHLRVEEVNEERVVSMQTHRRH